MAVLDLGGYTTEEGYYPVGAYTSEEGYYPVGDLGVDQPPGVIYTPGITPGTQPEVRFARWVKRNKWYLVDAAVLGTASVVGWRMSKKRSAAAVGCGCV